MTDTQQDGQQIPYGPDEAEFAPPLQDEPAEPAGPVEVQDPPVTPAPVQIETLPAPTAADYAGEQQWPRERLIAALVRARTELDHVERMIDRLSRWILDTVPEQINPELGEVDVASIAIRLLTDWVRNPNGRLEEPVRRILDELDHLPGVDADAIREKVEVSRNHLARALTAEPRPRSGQGPAPTLESDDITIVRYDRDRYRVELDLAYQSIAQMFAAAVGHHNGPNRGLVEDVAEVRERALAAEQALLVALASRGDGDYPLPKEGTPAYAAWKRLVGEMVSGLVDAKLKAEVRGGAMMPVAGRMP
jgi:hypothetical protein